MCSQFRSPCKTGPPHPQALAPRSGVGRKENLCVQSEETSHVLLPGQHLADEGTKNAANASGANSPFVIASFTQLTSACNQNAFKQNSVDWKISQDGEPMILFPCQSFPSLNAFSSYLVLASLVISACCAFLC